MEHFVWLMDLWRMQAEWRSVSMECGEQCATLSIIIIIITRKAMLPQLCVTNWGTMLA